MQVYTLLLMFVFCSSCRGQHKPAPQKEKIKPKSKDVSTSRRIDTKYEYTDSLGANLIIENGFPRGNRYTDPKGKVHAYALFWTRIINETDHPLELKIDFPVNSFEPPWLPGKYYQLLIPPDTMSIEKEPLYDYGLTGLKSFIDTRLHKPSSLNRTINPKESSGFYVVILCLINEAAPGALRTGLSVKGQDLFYKIKVEKSTDNSKAGDKEILCGSISLRNLMLQK